MTYCDNCGAKLIEGAEFCDECGAKAEALEQEVQNVEQEPKAKKSKKVPFIIAALLLIICIAGTAGYLAYNNYSDKPKQAAKEKAPAKKTPAKEAPAIEKDNLLETIPWEKDSEETDREVDKFIGNNGTYQIADATLNSIITVTVLTEEMIKIEMNISNHTYDLEFKGRILSENTAQIILDAGEEVNLIWNNSKEFITIPLNGFTGESTSMMALMCQCLNNQIYKEV